MTRDFIWIDIARLEDNVHEMKDVLCAGVSFLLT